MRVIGHSFALGVPAAAARSFFRQQACRPVTPSLSPQCSPSSHPRSQLCPLTNRIADSQGLFIYAGTSRLLQFTAGLGGCNAWNATTACCNDAVFAGGDVDFIRAAVAQALAAAPGVLDARRVFVVGIASGGFMALKVACAAPDLVRGVVAYAAASELNFAAMCPLGAGGYAPPVLMIHGTNDVVCVCVVAFVLCRPPSPTKSNGAGLHSTTTMFRPPWLC